MKITKNTCTYYTAYKIYTASLQQTIPLHSPIALIPPTTALTKQIKTTTTAPHSTIRAPSKHGRIHSTHVPNAWKRRGGREASEHPRRQLPSHFPFERK